MEALVIIPLSKIIETSFFMTTHFFEIIYDRHNLSKLILTHCIIIYELAEGFIILIIARSAGLARSINIYIRQSMSKARRKNSAFPA